MIKIFIISNCTTVGQLPCLKFLPISNPKDLTKALKNNLEITTNNNNQKTENYIKCIESLAKINNIQEENYLFLFKILLYVEEFAQSVEMKKHNLKCHAIKRFLDNIFTISVPTLNIDDPFVKMEDRIILKESDQENCTYNVQIVQIFNKSVNVVVPTK